MIITGTTQYQSLSGGFWGIIGDDGQPYRPTEMPEALQQEGLRVEIEAKKKKAAVSIFMWGTTISIVSFKIL